MQRIAMAKMTTTPNARNIPPTNDVPSKPPPPPPLQPAVVPESGSLVVAVLSVVMVERTAVAMIVVAGVVVVIESVVIVVFVAAMIVAVWVVVVAELLVVRLFVMAMIVVVGILVVFELLVFGVFVVAMIVVLVVVVLVVVSLENSLRAIVAAVSGTTAKDMFDWTPIATVVVVEEALSTLDKSPPLSAIGMKLTLVLVALTDLAAVVQTIGTPIECCVICQRATISVERLRVPGKESFVL